jgi:hypothetical protein
MILAAGVLQVAISALILGVLILAIVQLIASQAFRGKILGLAARLRVAPPVSTPQGRVPALIDAYARRAGAEPGKPWRTASFTQSGEMRLKKGAPFVPLTAWEIVALGAPGIVWDGRIAGGGLKSLRVVDSLVEGQGLLEARLFGSLRLARKEGDATTLAEAFRYLAELPWMPDAMLGNPGIRWAEVGPHTVEAALDTAGGRAAVRFAFDQDGDITGVTARGRPAEEDGQTVTRDWAGRFGDYTQIGPRRLPATGEVGYIYPDGAEIYFRARIADYRLTA